MSLKRATNTSGCRVVSFVPNVTSNGAANVRTPGGNVRTPGGHAARKTV